MHVLKSYDQVGVWDPTDPSIRMREVFTGMGPGGYSSFYWKTGRPDASLKGLRGGTGFWSNLPSWLQTGIIGVAAVGVGYFGTKKFGPTIKAALKR